MAKFDLGDFAKTLRNVPDSGTSGLERIEYIPLSDLHEDERNFYALTGIDELAANIQLCGLMDPLRVRRTEDGYTIVSGHRRFAALRLLAAEDEKFSSAACIIEAGDTPTALQELRLIYANSDTRKMSSADIGKQAERVEALLYELKEQGMEFPGRMRDHVAEACRISKSKLSRLKKINDHLAACYKPLWDSGNIPEDTADALSSLPEDVQERIRRVCPKKLPCAYNIRRMHDKLEQGKDYCTAAFACPDGAACTHLDKFFRHDLNCGGNWETCDGHKCCVKCTRGGAKNPNGGNCYNAACTEMCARAKAIYEEAKAKAKAKTDQEHAKAHNKAVSKAMADAHRIVRAADAAGLGDKMTIKNSYSGRIGVEKLRDISHGNIPNGMSDYQLKEIVPYRSADLSEMAAQLHCSTDYLLGLTDEPRTADEVAKGLPEPGQLTLGCWMPGGTNPAHPCDCIVILDLDSPESPGKTVRQQAYWERGAFWFGKKSPNAIDLPILAWLEIPEWKGGNGDA